MNVMITNLSLINGNKKNKEGEQLKPYKYEYKDEGKKEYAIEAIQTNEAATKFYIEWLRNRNEHLDKIVYLASEEVRVNKRIIEKGDKTFWTINEETENGITTEEYYKNIIQDFAGNDKLEFIAVDYGSDGITSSLDEIAKNLEEGDVVYLDTTGGKRDYGNSLQLLVKFLNYKGVTVKMPLYCDMNFQSGVGAIKIVDTYDLLEVLDGVNQFVTTGRSTILEKVFEVENVKQVKELLGEMNKFSDDILICKVDKLDEYYNKIKTIVNSLKDNDCLNVNNKLVIFKQMLDIIKSKFIGTDIGDRENDILNVLQWCVDNDLIQQALTICDEKLPYYIFNKKIVKYCGVANIKKYNVTDEQKATDQLYSGLLLYLNDKATNIKNIYLANKEAFEKYYNNKSKEIIWKKYSELTDAVKKKIKIEEKDAEVLQNSFLKDKTFKLFEQLKNDNKSINQINTFFNDINKINDAIGEQNLDKQPVVKKMEIIAQLDDYLKLYPEMVKIHKEIDLLYVQNILYDYIYVRCARNSINHASNPDKFNDAVNEAYSDMKYAGFNNGEFDKNGLTPESIKINLKRFIYDIETACKKIVENK